MTLPWTWPPAIGGSGGGSGEPQPPLPHASTHEPGGEDPIRVLGYVTADAIKANIALRAYAASTVLDVTQANDFVIGPLTGNITINFTNADPISPGHQGSILIQQDGVGGRSVAFGAPGGFLLKRDSAIADLTPAPGANALTLYTWFTTRSYSGSAWMVMTKMILV